ncbi:hypothetical protein [Lysinibacillus sp. ZYM-1]|uniref:hypothetical protein n=1 Tax=Lysinibacillus sp. ZYM-1 TaxID=1681184 RepID=UPI0006CE93DD|nr:hypothetical protein [Lysinibacillus sp. ZYM-1]KPN89527.1 hypothetical protein AO843_08860 [Lysinibacillus sp. ZYM-1]
MDFINYLTVDQRIAVLTTLATFTISVISVVIAVRSLKVTKRSIDEANRPYVVASVMGNVGYRTEKLLMIKNYGNTGATIESIKFSEDITEEELLIEFLNSLSGVFIAPGQSFMFTLNKPREYENITLVGEMVVIYKDFKNKFTEKCKLNSKIINTNLQISSDSLSEFENKLLNTLHNNNRQK